MTLIATTKELTDVCSRLATHTFVTVDTEFLRETTFWPRLCVVQIASDEEAVAIDAMAEGLDLTPFFELMADTGLTKVFHAARQDLEIIWNLAKLIPAPLFDTQVAAMVCGFGDQVSYGDLVKTVTKVTLDKSSRFTDWSRRPLLPSQAEYAIADVTYLRDIYRFLRTKLDETGRLGWLDDEMAILTSPAIYEQHPENAWERFSQPGPQTARSRGADGGRRLARERGAGAGCAALADFEGRHHDRTCARGTENLEALGNSARLSARHGTLTRGRRYCGGDRTRPRPRPQDPPKT